MVYMIMNQLKGPIKSRWRSLEARSVRSTRGCYLRNHTVVLITRSSEIIVLRALGRPFIIRDDVSDVTKILTVLNEPSDLADVSSRAGIPLRRCAQILESLVKNEMVVRGPLDSVLTSRGASIQSRKSCKKLIFGISGTIQAGAVAHLPLLLRESFAEEVEVVLTDSATRFLHPQLVSWFGLRVWTDSFCSTAEINVPHIYLASKADMILILPASANVMHRLAVGACSDLLSLVVAASAAPVVLAPTMNRAMFVSAAVQRNINRLREDGVYVVEPGLGFEVSKTSRDGLTFCGVGTRENRLINILDAVLSSRRSTKELKR
jgi:3-polyprenyl-4-hydroxybenzoate decarboxylase